MSPEVHWRWFGGNGIQRLVSLLPCLRLWKWRAGGVRWLESFHSLSRRVAFGSLIVSFHLRAKREQYRCQELEEASTVAEKPQESL